MYRLLIITRKKATEELFATMTQRDLGDFKAPHFRRDYEGALQCLDKHAIDAIAFDDPDEAFSQYVEESLPDLPLFRVGRTAEEQKAYLKELGRLLLRLRADDVNGRYPSQADRMEHERTHWIKQIIAGAAHSGEELERFAALYRCDKLLRTPCWDIGLSVPEDDDFMLERWHYGKNRLELALLNFFGMEHEGWKLYVVVQSPVEIRLLMLPTDGHKLMPQKEAERFITETEKDIRTYLGLSMSLQSVRKAKGLADFIPANAD